MIAPLIDATAPVAATREGSLPPQQPYQPPSLLSLQQQQASSSPPQQQQNGNESSNIQQLLSRLSLAQQLASPDPSPFDESKNSSASPPPPPPIHVLIGGSTNFVQNKITRNDNSEKTSSNSLASSISDLRTTRLDRPEMYSYVHSNQQYDDENLIPNNNARVVPGMDSASLKSPVSNSNVLDISIEESHIEEEIKVSAAAAEERRRDRSLDEKFYCKVCLSLCNPDDNGSIQLQCGHRFCRECASGYVTIKIREAQVQHMKCPNVDSNGKNCEVEFLPEEIRSLVTPSIWQKRETFLFNQQFPNARQCPRCDFSQLGDEAHPEMTCGNCGCQYCYAHSDAHKSNVSCADFEARTRETDALSAETVKRTCKPCPNCKRPIQKSEGCNSVRCTICDTHFCWICGKVISDASLPAHFAFWNVLGCSGQQMDEDAVPRSLARKIIHAVCVCVFVLPLAAIAFIVTFCAWLVCLPLSSIVYRIGHSKGWSSCLNWLDFQISMMQIVFVVIFGPPIFAILAATLPLWIGFVLIYYHRRPATARNGPNESPISAIESVISGENDTLNQNRPITRT